MEIGVDIVEISRFDDLVNNQKFLEKNFTNKEINYCRDQFKPVGDFAARFAGKEAVRKALTPFYEKNVKFNKIEILNKESGNPYVKILDEDIENLKLEIKISLSHSKQFAIGMAMVLKK